MHCHHHHIFCRKKEFYDFTQMKEIKLCLWLRRVSES